MPRYSDNTLETIKSRLRLSDVIGSYVKLTKSSSAKDDFKACCPFHHEKTPSFLVHDDKGFYKCFGCQKSGNMFTFVMEMDHVSFPEAVELLAKKAGVELKEETEKERKEYDKLVALQDIYNRIARSYRHILLNDKSAAKAREYISNRHINNEISEKFMLGYAFNDPVWLYNLLKNNDYSDDLIKQTGLFSKTYEKLPLFRNRILFPIRSWQGNVVAFSGRDLTGESKAKYINSPETPLYSKRNLLFGFFESLAEIKQKDAVYICEGNFDVISLHQAGITNACAPLGTAFTNEQAKLIKRYCKRINFLFDSDAAGQNATKKAIMIAQENDLECYVVKPFVNAKDASQMLEEQGEEKLKESCKNTEPAFSYLVHLAVNMYNTRTPKGKLSVFKEVSPYLDATRYEIERQGYIKYLSEILQIKEEEILNDYSKQKHISSYEDGVNIEPEKINVKMIKKTPELDALLLLINNRESFDLFRKQVRINSLDDVNAKKLYTVLEDAERECIRSDENILEMIDDLQLKNIVSASMNDGLYNKINVKDAIDSAVLSINLRELIEKRNNITKMLTASGMECISIEEYKGLLEAKNSLDREIEQIKKRETEALYI